MKFNFSQQIRFCGWSESLDLGYADLPTAINADASIRALLNDRVQCLGGGPIMVEAVLSAYVQPLTPGAAPVRRSTLSFPVPIPPQPGDAYNKAFGAPNYNLFVADFATTVLYLPSQTNLSSTPVYHRNLWMAGLPDISDQTNSATIVDARVLPAVQKYVSDLNNSGTTLGAKNTVSIRSIDRSGANPVKPCTAWNLGANSYTVPAHGFVSNQPILAEGMVTVKGGIAPRGRYLVGSVIDANTITLQGSKVPTTPVKTGGFRAAVVVFNAIQLVEIAGFTKRDKGRPSGLSVGRRPRPATAPA
jgi:hypothetical protein